MRKVFMLLVSVALFVGHAFAAERNRPIQQRHASERMEWRTNSDAYNRAHD
jgi:hypothetical protein